MKKPRHDLAAQVAALGADSLLPDWKPPKALDAIADVVLRYRPKPKTKPARRRKRLAAKMEREK
jgi:hypothetical protein